MQLTTDDGAHLHLSIDGPEQGPAVVLVHGLAGSIELSWRATGVIGALASAAALRGATDVDDDLPGFVAFFESIGADTAALADLFDHHQPTVDRWDDIVDRVLVVAGTDDTMAAPVEEVVERLPHATAHRVPGDHFTAPMAPAFSELVIEAARS